LTVPRLIFAATTKGITMRLAVAALLAVLAVLALLAVPAHAGAACHRASCGVLAPLYGRGYAPLDCAATVFPKPRWCRCWGARRVVLTARHTRAVHRVRHGRCYS
jgi:hypothetical protein